MIMMMCSRRCSRWLGTLHRCFADANSINLSLEGCNSVLVLALWSRHTPAGCGRVAVGGGGVPSGGQFV